ncbi:MAG: DotH/IcmK family type IV secretion protein [Desulfovibrio sp.]|jgi:intracellular multiplication protein IcmK|nr:DotH/IcmK family type IV secretion protein [Desulfovibrio sp.]
MKKTNLVFCLPAFAAVLLSAWPVFASDARETGHQGRVLGQPDTPAPATQPPPAAGSGQKQDAPADNKKPDTSAGGTKQDAPENKKPDAQALFEESLRQMMPLNEGQIQEYRERSDLRERALLPVSPELDSRTVHVALEPGRAPVSVRATANVATSLVFHDSTGQPWPITSVTNGGPSFFQVLRPELPDGNLLNIMPIQGYGTSTIVVTLAERDVPLVIRLESDSVRSPERKADALVLFRLAHRGPKAAIPILEDIKETVDSTMLAFLDHVPPAKAVRVSTEPTPDKLTVWKFNDHHYIRTSHALMWPAWAAVVNGAGGVKCYEVPVTSRIMIADNGVIHSIVLKEGRGK